MPSEVGPLLSMSQPCETMCKSVLPGTTPSAQTPGRPQLRPNALLSERMSRKEDEEAK